MSQRTSAFLAVVRNPHGEIIGTAAYFLDARQKEDSSYNYRVREAAEAEALETALSRGCFMDKLSARQLVATYGVTNALTNSGWKIDVFPLDVKLPKMETRKK